MSALRTRSWEDGVALLSAYHALTGRIETPDQPSGSNTQEEAIEVKNGGGSINTDVISAGKPWKMLLNCELIKVLYAVLPQTSKKPCSCGKPS
jgi:hypothetical protein